MFNLILFFFIKIKGKKIASNIASKILVSEEMKRKYLIENTKIPQHLNMNKTVYPFEKNKVNITQALEFSNNNERNDAHDKLRLSEPELDRQKLSFTSDLNSSNNFMRSKLKNEEKKLPLLNKFERK